MPDWLNTPVIVVAILAASTVLVKIGIWVGGVNRDRKSFVSFVEEIKTDIKEIKNNLTRILIQLARRPAFVPDSPLRLTDFGEEISLYLEAGKWADKLAPDVKKGIEAEDSPVDTNYDVQEYCLYYTQHHQLDSDLVRAIKNCAFDKGVDAEIVKRVFALVLRDKLLEGMPSEQ